MADLFTHPRWRKGMLVGVCLGVAGMVGLWGIAFFSPELITTALKNRPLQTADIVKPAEVCAALNAPANPALARLKADLSPEAIGQLAALRGAGQIPASTVEVLRQELNRAIQGGPLYEAGGLPIGRPQEGDAEPGQAGREDRRAGGPDIPESAIGGTALSRRHSRAAKDH